MANHIKDTTGLAQTLKDGGRPGLRKLSPWPHVQSQHRNLLGARAKPEPANKPNEPMKPKWKSFIYSHVFPNLRNVRLSLICKTQKETFSIQQSRNDQGLTSYIKNINKYIKNKRSQKKEKENTKTKCFIFIVIFFSWKPSYQLAATALKSHLHMNSAMRKTRIDYVIWSQSPHTVVIMSWSTQSRSHRLNHKHTITMPHHDL